MEKWTLDKEALDALVLQMCGQCPESGACDDKTGISFIPDGEEVSIPKALGESYELKVFARCARGRCGITDNGTFIASMSSRPREG